MKYLEMAKERETFFKTDVLPVLNEGIKKSKRVGKIEEKAFVFPLNGVYPKIVRNKLDPEFCLKRGTTVRLLKALGITPHNSSLEVLLKEYIDINKGDNARFTSDKLTTNLRLRGVLGFIKHICIYNNHSSTVTKSLIADGKAMLCYLEKNNMNHFYDKLRKLESKLSQ